MRGFSSWSWLYYQLLQLSATVICMSVKSWFVWGPDLAALASKTPSQIDCFMLKCMQ